MRVKVQKREIEVTNGDRVLFNGACYIMQDSEYFDGWYRCNPTLAKVKAQKMIKEGVLVYVGKRNYNRSNNQYDLYRFNTEGKEDKVY